MIPTSITGLKFRIVTFLICRVPFQVQLLDKKVIKNFENFLEKPNTHKNRMNIEIEMKN